MKDFTTLEDGEPGQWAKECGWTLEAGKGQKIYPSLEFSEGPQSSHIQNCEIIIVLFLVHCSVIFYLSQMKLTQ